MLLLDEPCRSSQACCVDADADNLGKYMYRIGSPEDQQCRDTSISSLNVNHLSFYDMFLWSLATYCTYSVWIDSVEQGKGGRLPG